ncbi:MAG: hypothetical protein WDA75_09870 [Candidatus Latescibacterota bacterium]|jgi:uncharacterized coiled-coil DUF342 family protein
MNWVFVLLAAGIVGLIAEMAMGYKKRMEKVRNELEELQQRIARYRQLSKEAHEKAEAVKNRILELEVEKGGLKGEVSIAQQQLAAREAKEHRLRPTRFRFGAEGEKG